MRPGIGHRGASRFRRNGQRRAAEHHERRHEYHDCRHLHFERLDFLTEVFRRATDHEPGDEHRNQRKDQQSIEPAADAAEDDFSQLHQPHRQEPAERRERIVHGVDAAVGRGRRGRGPERGGDGAESHFLPFQVAAALQRGSLLVDAELRQPRIAALLRVTASDHQRHEDQKHRGQQRPTLSLVAHQFSVRQAKRGRN